MVYDVAVIGGGVVGCSVLNKLTRLGKKVVLIEKANDVSTGASKANSGIVHAGFDAKTGTLKAQLNVRGANLFPKMCSELGVPFVNNGAIVVGSDLGVVKELYSRGVSNGVKNLEILENRSKVIQKLPSVGESITCALFAPTSAIVSPYKFTIALAEEAVINGASVFFNYDISSCNYVDNIFRISNGKQEILAKDIVIAVGSKHNEVANILGSKKYDIKFRRGEYYLLDKGAMDISAITIFPLPTKESKGVLIVPTVSGNILVGPTSILSENDSTLTTNMGLKEVAEKSAAMLNNVNLKKNIRVFSGVRTIVGDDFVIECDPTNSHIINVTGICSPGLSAAPAIAEYVCEKLGLDITKEVKITHLHKNPNISSLNKAEINKLIKIDSRYGKIVCRCEMVSEMEIINAINSPLRPCSIDAIKRRTRAGMGRCQGGFCMLKVMELIARERGMSIDEVVKENKDSRIIVGDIK